MECEDKDFWKALLTNRKIRSRFIRELEIQSIVSRSAEDLAIRYHQEEMLPRAAAASQKSASSRSW